METIEADAGTAGAADMASWLPDWGALIGRLDSVPQSHLLIATGLAMLVGWLGTLLLRRRIGFGRLLGAASSLTLGAVLLTVVLQLSHLDPRVDVFRERIGAPAQTVSGTETRVPLSRDGHFWVDAQIDGTRARFLVDTGATLTAVSEDTANRAGLESRKGGMPVLLQTANGTVPAAVTRIETVRFGNIETRNLDAVVAPSLGRTNVIGMNFLRELESWRVEGDTLIMVPRPADRVGPREDADR